MALTYSNGSPNSTYLNNWIPIEWDSEIIMRVLKASAIEATAQRHTMNTSTKRILRQQGALLRTASSLRCPPPWRKRVGTVRTSPA